jgi:hypothetical protein
MFTLLSLGAGQTLLTSQELLSLTNPLLLCFDSNQLKHRRTFVL